MNLPKLSVTVLFESDDMLSKWQPVWDYEGQKHKGNYYRRFYFSLLGLFLRIRLTTKLPKTHKRTKTK